MCVCVCVCCSVSVVCAKFNALPLPIHQKVYSRLLTHTHMVTHSGLLVTYHTDTIASQWLYFILMVFILICFPPCLSCICRLIQMLPPLPLNPPQPPPPPPPSSPPCPSLKRIKVQYNPHTTYICVSVWCVYVCVYVCVWAFLPPKQLRITSFNSIIMPHICTHVPLTMG